MTIEETKRYREWFKRNEPAMIAFEEGRPVQFYETDCGWKTFVAGCKPGWNPRDEYRAKPEATLRPYNRDELNALVGKSLSPSDGTPYIVIGGCPIDGTTVSVSAHGRVAARQLLTDWKHLDGSPCGVME